MPSTYSILPELNLVRHRVWGQVSTHEFRDFSLQVRADPRFRTGMNILADLRDATLDVSQEEMMEFTKYMSKQSAIGKHAVVVAGPLAFGLTRMYELMSDSMVQRDGIRIFQDMSAAEAWLGG